MYEAAWDWPVFPVPAWLLVLPAAVGAAVVLPLVVLTPAAYVSRLISHLGQTVPAIGAGVAFSVLFPAPTGTWPDAARPADYLGSAGVAAALSAFSLVVLLVGIAAKAPAHERLREAGDLPTDAY